MVCSSWVHAQNLRIDPSINSRLTYTDNARATARGGGDDWIAEITPAVGIARDGGRVTGRANMRLRNRYHAGESGRNRSFLTLDGAGTAEAVEDRFFIDADASIRRDNLGLFTGRQDDALLGGGTRADETRTYALGGRYLFRLGAFADGQVGYRSRWLDPRQAQFSAARQGRWNVHLANPTALGRIGWSANYVNTRSYYDDRDIDDVTQEVGRLTLFYNVSPQFRLRGIVGHESNDFGGPRRESGSITGAGFDWFPTPRTSISATAEDRFFGQGHDVTLNHRRARSTWQLSYGRDLSSSLQRFGSVFQDPLFVFFFEQPGIVEAFPDPVEREEIVREILRLPGEEFISSAFFIEDRIRATVSYLIRPRSRLTFSAFASDRERVQDLEGLREGDDFRDSERVRTQAATVSLSHRLTPLSSLGTSLTRSSARSSGGVERKTNRLRASVGYSTRLGPRTVAGLRYRYIRVDGRGGVSEYTENVITANLGIRF